MKKPSLKPLPKSERALLILLDVSGSMGELMEGEKTKLEAAFEAFRSVLVPRLSGWDLGILIFGAEPEEVTWLLPPTSQVELGALRRPEPQGHTPMWRALEMAHDWASRRAKGVRLVLITDGLPTDFSPDFILQHIDRGVPIDSIFVGGKLDRFLAAAGESFLRRLSELTGGQFAAVGDEVLLLEVLKALSPAERPLLGAPREK